MSELPKWSAEPDSYTQGSGTEPLTRAEAKTHLYIHTDDTDFDTYIDESIQQAREFAENITGLSLVSRTWDLYTDGFHGPMLFLPHGPVGTITSVNTTNTTDTESEYSSDNYIKETKTRAGEIARVFLKFGQVWPTGLRDFRCVRVRYSAGYTNANEANKPTMELRRTMLQYIKLYFDSENAGFVMTQSDRYFGIKQDLMRMREYYSGPFDTSTEY